MTLLARTRRFFSTPLSARLEAVSRDVVAVLGLKGSRGPSVRQVTREVAPRPTGEHRLTVVERVAETADAVTLVFAEVPHLSWKAGQFLTLTVPVDGGPVRRAYSVSRAPGGPLQVTVKRVAKGRASNWLVDHAAVGQVFAARGPSGTFVCEPRPGQRVLLVGAGSGITPLIAIAESLTDSARVHLVYGNRSPADTIFRDRLERMTATSTSLSTSWVFEDGQDPGRLTVDRLERELAPDTTWDEVFVCGPRPVMDAMRTLAERRGWPTPHEERFESLGEKKARASATPQSLHIKTRTGTYQTVVKPGQTLLEAGLMSGAPMQFSCTMGGCGACRVRLVEGEVVHDEPNGLSPAERDTGLVFACVARPTRACRIES